MDSRATSVSKGPLRGQWPEFLLATSLGLLSLQFYLTNLRPKNVAEMVLDAKQGSADMSLRNFDFPQTYIRSIHVDLTSPNHWVRLTWSGPQAQGQQTGPFHSSPGRGLGHNNCDDFAESNRGGSQCTPKGKRMVEGFGDRMPSIPICKFVTWIQSWREIALHSHPIIPEYPASSGCVRLPELAAQLIHNNAIAGRTEVIVEGTWTAAPE